MPVLNIASILGKKAVSQDYGFMIDSLDILKNQLEADGKPSSGDYDLLIKRGKEIYSDPRLSPLQKSNVAVKISSYQSDKQRSKITDTADISRMNNTYDNDIKETIYTGGNSPTAFLYGKMTALETKMFQLKESIEIMEQAGSDSSQQSMELKKITDQWLDVKDAYVIAESYKKGQPSQSDYSAYITTNSKGEIRDIDIERTGSKTGYYETNGILGGFPIYGKLNEKTPEGLAVFKIGNERFSAVDILKAGPEGTFKSTKLISESVQMPVGRSMTKAVSENYPVDSSKIRVENSSSVGDWIQGKDAFYKDLGNGTYEKYKNATKDQLRIDDKSLLTKLPDITMNSINSRVVKTNDFSEQFQPPVDMGNTTPSAPPMMTPVPTTPMTPLPVGMQQSKEPTVRSPQTFGGYAASTISKAKSFLGGLFGK